MNGDKDNIKCNINLNMFVYITQQAKRLKEVYLGVERSEFNVSA